MNCAPSLRRRLMASTLCLLTACAAGNSGKASLVKVSAEPAGANCASGGVVVRTGLDKNADGTLQDDEVDASQTKYVCNGTTSTAGANGDAGAQGAQGDAGVAGHASLTTITAEAPGSHCATGGSRLDSGLDTNGDGSLEASEVTATLYVCDRDTLAGVHFGDVTVSAQADLAQLDGITLLVGNLYLNQGAGDVTLPSLQRITNSVQSYYQSGVTSLSLPALTQVGSITVYSASDFTHFSAPLLTQTDSLLLSGLQSLVTVEVPKLATVGSLDIGNDPLLAALALPALTSVNNFSVNSDAKLDQCALEQLVAALPTAPANVDISNDGYSVACGLSKFCSTTTLAGLTGNVVSCTSSLTFDEAHTFCAGIDAGTDLVWFDSQSEWDAFSGYVLDGGITQNAWLGYSTTTTPEGPWLPVKSGVTSTLDTSPMNTTFWSDGEPNNYAGNDERCVLVYASNGRNNDSPCANAAPFVCRLP